MDQGRTDNFLALGYEGREPKRFMITIHPKALAQLIITQDKLDLIDVRPRSEFNRVHIRGARSVPLATLRPAKVLRERVGAKSEPVFLICWNRTRASMAAGLLREAGCQQPVVLDGGMELWQTQGLPVVHPIRFDAPALVKALARTVQPPVVRLHPRWSERLTELERFLTKPAYGPEFSSPEAGRSAALQA